MIMSMTKQTENRLRFRRQQKGWSQFDLAGHAGISRAAVSAIEMNRLSPSVTAALALAKALDCSVEELFAAHADELAPVWAWPCPRQPCRYWQATVGGRTILYPVEQTLAGMTEHDGVFRNGKLEPVHRQPANKTIVMACCDPASGILAAQLAERSGLRLLVLSRSSSQAVDLLRRGLVHVAGIHLATPDRPKANGVLARKQLGKECRLLRIARWQEGIALAPRSAIGSVRSALGSRLHWVGREPGSAARHCLDELFCERRPPRRIAFDHRGVAEAIRCGWADAGVCLRLVCEEAGLHFLPVRQEIFELCFRAESERDPWLISLKDAVRAPAYRRQLGDLPGYDPRDCGEIYTPK
jgi:molybdate-binding protein/transcriptional regulator with XRE-family HTH domain